MKGAGLLVASVLAASTVALTSSSSNKDVAFSEVKNAKPLVKEALQSQLGLPVDRNIPLIGFIGRLEEQKGSDILAQAIPKFMGENVQILVLGTGEKPTEQQIEQLEIICPEKARGLLSLLAHRITAGADFMLVPIRFEPCGLIQLHGMLYGTVPIVASTGGYSTLSKKESQDSKWDPSMLK